MQYQEGVDVVLMKSGGVLRICVLKILKSSVTVARKMQHLPAKFHSPKPSALGYIQPDPKNLEAEEAMYLLDDLMP